MIDGVLLRFLFAALAAGYLMRAWQTGSITAPLIAEIESGFFTDLAERRFAGNSTAKVLAEKLTDLLLCELCLAPYAVTALIAVSWIVPILGDLVLCIFAAAQVAYWCRILPHP